MAWKRLRFNEGKDVDAGDNSSSFEASMAERRAREREICFGVSFLFQKGLAASFATISLLPYPRLESKVKIIEAIRLAQNQSSVRN